MTLPPRIRTQGLALFIGVVCGVFCYLAGLPLPWMLGPMIGLTIASVAGAPVAGPDRLRGYNPVTAFYSAMPGGLNEMLIMGGAAGGNERKIALAHAARVLLVILFVALFFGLFLGVRSGSNPNNWVGVSEPTLRDYALLIAAAVIGLWLGRLLRLPAVPIFGPMIVSGVFHLVGWVEIAPPSVFIIAAQIVMGTIIGTRFIGATVTEIRRDLTLAAIGSGGMLTVAVGFAAAVTWAAGMSLSEAFLAFAPGGLTEMSLLTLAMGQDVTYVSTVHIVRITLVIAIAPAVFAALRNWLLPTQT